MGVLALLVAPLAVLVSWGEVDLSFVGLVPFGYALHSQNADEGWLVLVLLAGMLGLLIGAGVGIARWLTRVPSTWLTFAAGLLISAFAYRYQLGRDRRPDSGELDGNVLLMVMAFVVVAAALALASKAIRLFNHPDGPNPAEPGPPPGVIAGFMLSGFGASVSGVLVAGQDAAQSTGNINFLFVAGGGFGMGYLYFVVAALAFGGVTRGSGVLAPTGATLGLVAALLLSFSLRSAWGDTEEDVLLLTSALVLGCLMFSHGLRHALDGRRQRAQSGGGPSPGGPGGPSGPPAVGGPPPSAPPADPAPASPPVP